MSRILCIDDIPVHRSRLVDIVGAVPLDDVLPLHRLADEIVLTITDTEPMVSEPAPGFGKRHHQRAAKPAEIDPTLSRQQRRLYARKNKSHG